MRGSCNQLQESLAHGVTEPQHDLQHAARDEARIRGRNIYLIYVLSFFGMLMFSMSFGAWVDIFISDLSGKTNSFVGLVETVRGTVITVMSIVAGVLADKFSRAFLLRTSALLMIAPILMYAYGIWHEDLICMAVALPLFAASGQIGQEAQTLLLQDCCADQDRVAVLAKKNWAENVALGVGPLVQLAIVFMRNMTLGGDSDWSLGLMKLFLLSGLLIHPLVVILCVFVQHIPPGAGTSASGRDVEAEAWRSDRIMHGRVRRDVLVTVWATSCWIASVMGAGLTLKFVPLFWRRVVHLSPIGLLIVTVAEPWGLAVLNSITPRIAKKLGRAESCVVFVMLGAIFLVVFALGAGRSWMPIPLAATIWVLRTSTGRAWVPCLQSIIYTCVPATKQGRYTAVLSIKSYTFSVFSGVGGGIADRYGFRMSFMITAVVHALTALVFIPVVRWFAPAEDAIASEQSAPNERRGCAA